MPIIALIRVNLYVPVVTSSKATGKPELPGIRREDIQWNHLVPQHLPPSYKRQSKRSTISAENAKLSCCGGFFVEAPAIDAESLLLANRPLDVRK